MDKVDGSVTRRNLLIVGSLGAAALAGLAGPARAATLTAAETANVKLVEEFCHSWDDPDKAVAYLSSDAALRMEEDKPALVGGAAFVSAMKGFMSHGEKVTVKIFNTFAKGPVVVTTRVDTVTTPGKPDQPFKVVGVFIVKNGKIKEWSDYLEP